LVEVGAEVDVVVFSFTSVVATPSAISVYTVSIYASSVFTIDGASSDNGVSVVIAADQATSSTAPAAVFEIAFLHAASCEATTTGAMENSQVSYAL
jgi:hypothetical protein